ncbi:MAG TPA: ribbon-helix-helix domain-containing protein [Paracoccus sp. (in: a-proteobacteria)]|uniref:ribbon-helix-helix domain-containing protein n=1 Tax=Paracoccus sp. TaxID=267 RepID=UPI002BE48A56|nr:ribbon-helix-helix domain-containing protein [Paracoccus sp. (in: a-proteobacteria)]HWL57502.1 ribbon-helix-helix domain-containing protein [Paracoccus sp. (in: a-proteobacteria)]
MPDLPAMSPPVKRSVTIGGHRTSVSLEDAFWRELRNIARAREETVAALIAVIDSKRPPEVGLATALRLYVLSEVLRRGADRA